MDQENRPSPWNHQKCQYKSGAHVMLPQDLGLGSTQDEQVNSIDFTEVGMLKNTVF